jgi:hypothetical protein
MNLDLILARQQLKALATKDIVYCMFLVWLGVPLGLHAHPNCDRDALRDELRRREWELAR